MGRKKIGDEYKKPSDYKYHYPEQEIYGEVLEVGKITKIANKLGISVSHVTNMCKGIRRMTSEVKELADIVIKNQGLEKLQLEVALEKMLGPSKKIKNTKLI